MFIVLLTFKIKFVLYNKTYNSEHFGDITGKTFCGLSTADYGIAQLKLYIYFELCYSENQQHWRGIEMILKMGGGKFIIHDHGQSTYCNVHMLGLIRLII